MKKSDFTIERDVDLGWYVFIKETNDYLFKPGIVVNWFEMFRKIGNNKGQTGKLNKLVYFSTKKELEKCLDNCLKGRTTSNINEQIASRFTYPIIL